MFITLLPHMFLAAAHVYGTLLSCCICSWLNCLTCFAAALVYSTCFLLPHMYTKHVEQFWLIWAVVIWPVMHFWTNCETAQNLFKNKLIQGLTWFVQPSHFFVICLTCVEQLAFLCWADFSSYRNSSSWYAPDVRERGARGWREYKD